MKNDTRKQDAPHSVSGNVVSRRDFLALTGMTTATLALGNAIPAQERAAATGTGSIPLDFRPGQLADTHDLVSLPAWGPYSKKFFGISYIPDLSRGLSFDVSVFPSLVSAPAVLPSVTERCGVHPWEAATGLDFYSYRFENLGSDHLYCDVSFCRCDGLSRLISAEFVNDTDTPRQVALNCLAQLCFPPLKELSAEPVRLCAAELPPGAPWIHALDYADLTYAKPRPTDNLVPDGRLRGEMRLHDCVGGSAVGDRFGGDAGDTVSYRLRLNRSFQNATLVWRFQLERGRSVRFQMEGIAQREIEFQGSGDFATVTAPLGPLAAGTHDLRLVSRGGADVVLNGFAVVGAAQASDVRFPAKPWSPEPQIESLKPGGVLLAYRDTPNCYGLTLDGGWVSQRQLKWRDLDKAFGNQSNAHTRERIFGNGRDRSGDPDSLFMHLATQPLTVPPNSRLLVHGIVSTGTADAVRQSLAEFNPHADGNERMIRNARERAFQFHCSPGGEPFRFSQQRMAAVTLTNVVYPLYVDRKPIRHYSPGKIWDCIYTWDSGFIGLGLLELDPERALENLNAYTTAEGAQSAFLHHGTPLPTQIYLYSELWNRTQSHPMLAYLYPRLRQYHRFLMGRLGSSTTRRHRDGLLATWDYFYNSGGWDDYPPQKFVHQQKLTRSATPVINSAHAIRCAKLLRGIAEELGERRDCAEYDRDIAELTESLEKYSWDEESGYFGYVMRDAADNPAGILRADDGTNFNMGLDGVTPLIAGICTPAQEQRILDHMFSPEHLWTDVGITTVDRSASYYNPDGYWNGSVWLAHQWFLWKAMLDLGRGDLAIRIARAGLDVWRKTTDASHDCMEHFVPRPPFGEGWHQFSSLSSPALSWFAALYTPGRFTCGFDAWLSSCEFRDDYRELRAKLAWPAASSSRERSVLACMKPGWEYQALWCGAPVRSIAVHDGLLQVQIPARPQRGELSVHAMRKLAVS